MGRLIHSDGIAAVASNAVMNSNIAAPVRTPKFGMSFPVPIRLSALKLPEGMAKSKTLQGVKHQPLDRSHASGKMVSGASNKIESVVPVSAVTPGTAVEFDRIAPHKKPVRYPPSVSLEGDGYLRLEDVLTVYPVSRSAWYEGIKQGIYPAPIPLGRRSVGWSRAAIRALVESPPKF